MSRLFLAGVAVPVVLLLLGCGSTPGTPPAARSEAVAAETLGRCRESTLLPDPIRPDLDCPAPPNTFDVSRFFPGPDGSARDPQLAGPTYDSWAWASFAAFNWPALASSEQPTGYVRGIPDLGKSFLHASSTDVLVWETFKEKREVFNNVVTPAGWQSLTYPPEQMLDIEPGGQLPACTPVHADRARKLPGGAHRRILQASKLAGALAAGAHQLDETAQVASPAQEPEQDLCQGFIGEPRTKCEKTFAPPPGGGSQTPYPRDIPNPRPPVGPRVYDQAGNIIFYEVRVNYDYFALVTQNNLNFLNPVDGVPLRPSQPPPYPLLWRTSAQMIPPLPVPPPKEPDFTPHSATRYDANLVAALQKTLPPAPLQAGSVQIKSAWRMLPFPLPDYHSTEAVYFMSFEDPKTGKERPCYAVGTFGLIGLHIIQRVHMGTSLQEHAEIYGGTYVFATWEHTSIGDGAGYSYVTYIAHQGAEQDTKAQYPAHGHSIPVRRQHRYPLETTEAVTSAVHARLPRNSVWRNYRLIGTQFYPRVTPETSEGVYNQPYYLANLVIETNRGLQNFQGLPPMSPILTNYKGFTRPGKSYEPDVPNVAFRQRQGLAPSNMGGCMGCHGVAQLAGTAFSFVLLEGQKGAGIDTTTHISIPPQVPTMPTGRR